MSEEMNPLGEMVETAPPLPFGEIDRLCMEGLCQIDMLKNEGAHPLTVMDQMETLLLGTMKEMLRTLRHYHPDPPRIQVLG